MCALCLGSFAECGCRGAGANPSSSPPCSEPALRLLYSNAIRPLKGLLKAAPPPHMHASTHTRTRAHTHGEQQPLWVPSIVVRRCILSLFEALDEETTLGSRKREDYLSFSVPFPLSFSLILSFFFSSFSGVRFTSKSTQAVAEASFG